MDKNEPITLVTVCDNQFVVLMAALLKSLEINHTTGEKIDLYIVNDGMSKQNQEKLISSLSTNKLNLIWKTMDESIPKNLKIPLDKSSFPANVYIRICVPHFVNPNATKAIYLDVDMIVLEDISKLWHTDIGTYNIAAVKDLSDVVSSDWGGIENYKELGLDPNSKYLNAGLLVMKPKEWRRLDITKKAFDCAAKNKAYLTFADQYVLNVIFNQNWLELDPLWNCYSMKTDKNPHLIHFTGIKPIFKGYKANEEYKKIFFTYLDQTAWANFKPKSDLMMLIKKLYNKIEKKTVLAFK